MLYSQLMKVYSGKGDTAFTSTIQETRLPKHDLQITCLGTIDELNSSIGMIPALMSAEPALTPIREILHEIQKLLINISSIVAGDDQSLPQSTIANMEKVIDYYQGQLPELSTFVIPTGSPAGSACHFARTVCRRAERIISALNEKKPLDRVILQYFNRLSDLLFVLALAINKIEGKAGELTIKYHA